MLLLVITKTNTCASESENNITPAYESLKDYYLMFMESKPTLQSTSFDWFIARVYCTGLKFFKTEWEKTQSVIISKPN